MRLIDVDPLIEDLKYDVELDNRLLDDTDYVGLDRTLTQFDKDCKQNAIELLKNTPTAHLEPKWVLCSERLPEDTVIVTAKTKTFKHKYVCEAVWIPRWSKKAEYDNWEDCSEYNEDEDEYYVLEGWYERVHNWDEYSFVGIEDDVIAWMPLPKPYGGEPG